MSKCFNIPKLESAVRSMLVRVLVVGSLLGCAKGLKAQDTLDLVKDHYTVVLSGIADSARWGTSVAAIGDLDGDSVPDMAVSQSNYNGSRGAVWILLMNDDGTVKDDQRISNNYSGLPDTLDAGDVFGGRLAALDDLDGDGLNELAVLAAGDDDGASNRGAVYILRLQDFTAHNDTAIKGFVKISDLYGGFAGAMTNNNGFAGALAGIGDQNGDGKEDLAVGAYLSDDGGSDRGALWVLLLNSSGSVTGYRKYSSASTWPSPGSPLTNNGEFGFAADDVGDLDGDGVIDLAVTARIQNGRGTIHFLFLNSDGTIKSHEALVPGVGSGLTNAPTYDGGHFGWSLVNVGDLNGDGTDDLLNGMRAQSDSYSKDGAVSVIYLNPDGSVQWDELISHSTISGGLGLHNEAFFGWAVAAVGDIDGDAVMDIAVSANGHNGGGTLRGQLYVFELNAKPLLVQTSVIDETPTAAGSIGFSIVGGVRPYEFYWGEDFPPEEDQDDLFEAVDTAGFAQLGLPVLDFSDLTYAELRALSLVDTDSVHAGCYPVRIQEASGGSYSADVCVGRQLSAAVSTGVTFSGGKIVLKTASNGWTNMEFLSANILYTGVNGWLSFYAPQVNSDLVVGVRPIGVAQTGGYQQMSYAFYLDEDSVKLWYGSALHATGMKYKVNDRFWLGRIDSAFVFRLNEVEIERLTGISPDISYQLDLCINKNAAKVISVSTDFVNDFHVQNGVFHLSPLAPKSGSIAIRALPIGATYTVDWADLVTDVEDRTGLGTGEYDLEISSNNYSGSQSHVFAVGNDIHWKEHQGHSDIIDNNGRTLTRAAGGPAWNVLAVSRNLGRAGLSEWVRFTAGRQGDTAHATIVGLRDEADSSVCAAIWVHPFGKLHLAVAIDSSGIVGRAFVQTGDRLGIAVTGAVSEFTRNGTVFGTGAVASSTLHRVVASVRDTLSVLSGLATSLAVPIELNTSMLEPGIAYTATPPATSNTHGTSGGRQEVYLEGQPSLGYHVIDIPASSGNDAIKLLMELYDGEVSTVRVVHASETLLVDTALYETRYPNHVILYDEPEVYVDEVEAPYTIDLEGQLLMTPNDDESFDEFAVLGVDPEADYSLEIRDREDNLLFQTTDATEAWNGKYMNTGSMQDPGVYKYRIVLNGGTEEGLFHMNY